MRLVSFVVGDRASWGAVIDGAVADGGLALGAACPSLRALLALPDRPAALAALADAPRHAVGAVRWLPPIPDPAKILCVGVNYDAHRVETGRTRVGHPTIFTRFADTQTGHDTAILRPAISCSLDFEGELAVVIGRPCHRVGRDDALNFVAGYSCYMDGSVRDWQRHTSQFTPGKNFPRTGGFGPWLVTADTITPADLRDLGLRTRLNGAVVQEATVAEMIFDVPALIEYCSAFTPLAPGDVIATGTPGGVGERREPPLWLRPGDVIEVEIDRIGLLRNRVSDAS